MSSGDHLWSQQWNYQPLQMFMPAGELRKMPSAQVEMGHSWKEILLESRDRRPYHGVHHPSPPEGSPTLYEDIRDKGVHTPVELSRTLTEEISLRHGHHRVASMAHIDPEREVPVEHYG